MLVSTVEQALTELVEQHRVLYEGPTIEAKLRPLIRIGLHTNLTQGDVLHILRTSRSVFFDTHVEVVSGHHTGTYIRFDSIARFPELIRKVAGDMAGWIQQMFRHNPITGLVATSSAAEQLAEGVAAELRGTMRVNVALTSYSCETGRIGTDVAVGAIKSDQRFLALNDVTTRGNCVGKLGKVITDNGGVLAGMLVFARRDSGQFPLMNELVARRPFYYTTDLDMSQWEPVHCPLCQANKTLISWRDLPAL